MIEKFNFYDIYGNLFPGIALIGLLWIPFGIVLHWWPTQEVSSALLALLSSYFVGHLLQISANVALPSTVKSARGRRYPSDFILDQDDGTFSPELKAKLATLVRNLFGLDIESKPGLSIAEWEALSKRRQDAFRQARASLIVAKIQSYGEQFEGLYALMRAIALAFGIACFYFIGWGFGWSDYIPTHRQATLVVGVLLLVVLAVALASYRLRSRKYSEMKIKLERLNLGAVAVIAFLSGAIASWGKPLTSVHTTVFCLLALGWAIGAVRCYSAYKFFAKEFARAIWNDFLSAKTNSVHKGFS